MHFHKKQKIDWFACFVFFFSEKHRWLLLREVSRRQKTGEQNRQHEVCSARKRDLQKRFFVFFSMMFWFVHIYFFQHSRAQEMLLSRAHVLWGAHIALQEHAHNV